MHLNHFERTLGAKFPLPSLTLADLQRHVHRRREKKYRGKSSVQSRSARRSPPSAPPGTGRRAWRWSKAASHRQGSSTPKPTRNRRL
jgi:hypothetical protein